MIWIKMFLSAIATCVIWGLLDYQFNGTEHKFSYFFDIFIAYMSGGCAFYLWEK